MRILLAAAAPCFPFAFDGGAQRAQQELARRLVEKGHEVDVFCGLPRDEVKAAVANAEAMGHCVRVVSPPDPCDGPGAVPTARHPHVVWHEGGMLSTGLREADLQEAWGHRIAQHRPHVLVTWLRGSIAAEQLAQAAGIPALLRVFDPVNWMGQPRKVASATTVIANAPVTAHAASQRFGRHVPFLLEPVDHSAYVVHRRVERCVTFINPTNVKGLALFHAIAQRLPEIPFLVVRGWSWAMCGRDDVVLRESLASMPNVRVEGPLADMRAAYERTALLLAPSRWPEAWGRVACEAQASGIPVLASDRGSLPQNVGRGGVVLEYGDPDLWADTIRHLYHDQLSYERLSQQALENVQRFPFGRLIEQYADVLAQIARGEEVLIPPVDSHVAIYRVRRDGPGLSMFEDRILMDQPAELRPPAHP